MPDHYYSPVPQSAHKPAGIDFSYRGQSLRFHTDSGVFSRLEIDKGTELLLHTLPQTLFGQVLDMGCGYGVIGLSVGKVYADCNVTLADVNERAVELTKKNAGENGVSAHVLQSDGYAEIPCAPAFDLILQNPPIRAGKAVIYQMFADAANRLFPSGELWLVIRKQQGAPSAVAYLQTLFASVCTVEKKKGYWILRCQSPSTSAQQGASIL